MQRNFENDRVWPHLEEYLSIAALVLVVLLAFAIASVGYIFVAALVFVAAVTPVHELIGKEAGRWMRDRVVNGREGLGNEKPRVRPSDQPSR